MWTRFLFRSTSRRQQACRSRSLTVEQLEDRCLLSADPVLEWNGIALDAIKNDSYLGANQQQPGPERAARALAIVQAAVFDSVNSIDRSYDPYMIQVDAAKDASITAATAQAAHDTLVNLYPAYQSVLDAKLSADLASVTDVSARNDGALVGKVAAAAILAARSSDGSNLPMTYTFQSGPGQWQPDSLHPNQVPVGPEWGNVTTFALPVPPNRSPHRRRRLTSQQYADALNEVKEYGGDGINTPTLRTPEETQIGIFWGYDGSPGLGTPPRLYNQIAEDIAVQQGNTVVQNARMFALIDIGLADASIVCWDTKYDDNFWRPVTGIREDGNPADANWTPLGAPADNGSGTNFTPAFPSYTSGHATFGGTLFRLMADFYGTDNIHFTLGSDEFNGSTQDQNGMVRPVVYRSFNSFSQAAEENGQSRIYLGIHWSFDKTEGITCGTEIADYMFANLLKPRTNKGRHEDRGGAIDSFRASLVKDTGAVVLKTTDHKPFDPNLSTNPASTTIPTTATNTRDAAALTSSLISYLNGGPWGGTSRGGHVLEVDLDASGSTFSVF